MRYKLFIAILVILALILLAACGTPTPPPTPTPEPVAKELIFYDWGDGIPSAVVDAFTEKYGIEVTYLAYDTQEEALENMKAGEAYDLVVLDNAFLPETIQDDMLAEIDFRNIPNFKHVLANWADLWELRNQGKIAVRDEPRETIGFALKSLGHSSNSEDPAELEAALEHLLEIKDDIVFVDSYAEDAVPLLASGEAAVLVGWVEDLLYARDEGESLVYVFPKEGVILWGDSFVIPANSPHKENAELFLDFILEPEHNAEIVNETYYATAHEAVRSLVDPEIQEDPVIFPPKEMLQNAEVTLSVSPEATELYEEIWERLRAEVQ
jgi:spermidine/putrescine-binding protein